MTYDQKIETARKLIEQHNCNVEASHQIDIDYFLERLRNHLGGTTDAALMHCTWEELQECSEVKKDSKPVTAPLPKLLAKQIAEAFRKNISKPGTSRIVSDRRAASMTAQELLEAYNPKDAANPVGNRLGSLSQGLPCLVFRPDGSLAVEASLECLQDIQEGLEPRAIYMLDGMPTRLLRIGEKLDSILEENPLYPGRSLRGSEQFCDQTNRSWKGINTKVRVLLYLALTDSRELKITQINDAHNMLDLIVSKSPEEAEKAIQARFPQAALRYQELALQSKLPTLKLIRNGNNGPKLNNPFGKRNQTF